MIKIIALNDCGHRFFKDGKPSWYQISKSLSEILRGKVMTLLKTPVLSSLFTDKWMSDFFDNDRFFDADWLKRMQVVPAVNVRELKNEFEIEMAAPGLNKKDFKINIENGVMTIFTETKEEKEEKEENFTRREFNYTSFTRSFNLPENVNPDKIDAKYENGILRLLITKKVVTPEKLLKTIEVK